MPPPALPGPPPPSVPLAATPPSFPLHATDENEAIPTKAKKSQERFMPGRYVHVAQYSKDIANPMFDRSGHCDFGRQKLRAAQHARDHEARN
jgi:hypothetical protein